MNCNEFLEALEESVLCRVVPSGDVAQHGAECTQSACQSAWLECQLLQPAIRDWQTLEALVVVPTFESVAEFSEPSKESRRGTTAPTGSLAAWLAVAAASVAVLSLISLRPSGPPDSLVVTQQIESPTPVGEVLAEADTVQELGSTTVEWIQGSTGRITDTLVSVLVEDSNDMPQPPPVWLQRLEESWAPVGDSLQQSFRDLLPTATVEMGNAS